MKTLGIDIETYSSRDIGKSGVYAYADSSDFQVLLFAYSIDNAPAQIIDLACGETLPSYLLEALTDPAVLKTAYNAPFERICLSTYLGLSLPADQWECTMVKAAMVGLPFGLGFVSRILHLPEEKMGVGKSLIRYFCVPCKPSKANGGRTRNQPSHAPDKWELFRSYCIRDVDVEQAIRARLDWYFIPESEKRLWYLDQQINDRGVLIDMAMVQNALHLDATCKDYFTTKATEITGLNNPNSVAQLKQWLEENTGCEVNDLSKASVADMLQGGHDEAVIQTLRIRQEMAKTSVKKYSAMQNAACSDHRVHGMLQFYGANRTGRWAGRLLQTHNLPQNHIPDLDLARQVVKKGDFEDVQLLYGNVPDTLSQLIRTAFIAKEGHTFVVADFSAIEARVISWLAGEQWRMEVFRTHGKIYEASASAMFHVPIEQIKKGNPLRQKGKVAELALGYGGGPNALVAMGALRMGLEEDELPELVEKWRQANRSIVTLWRTANNAAIQAVSEGKRVEVKNGVSFFADHGILFAALPSGRCIAYYAPHIATSRFDSPELRYMGLNQITKKWEEMKTYGGKIVENLVQSIARDCLAVSMLRLAEAGFDIVMHVHDEVILEVPLSRADALSEACEIMGQAISWAQGLPLRADGYVTPYYKKD